MDCPLISVIIPIYKTEATLSRTIESVLSQSFDDYELVLVDDGTPDGAGAIADDYASRYSHIHVVHQENRGLAEARKSGHKAAHGRYHMHLDSDDTMPAGALEFLAAKAVGENLDIIHGGYNYVTDEGDIVPCTRGYDVVVSGEELLRRLLTTTFHIYGGMCFSRGELWSDDVFPPAHERVTSEDTISNIGLAMKAQRVGLYDFPVYNYHFNPHSLTATGAFFKLAPMKRFFELMREHLQGCSLPPDEVEHLVRMQEVHFVGFYLKEIDMRDEWVRRVAHYADAAFPRKTRVLQFLIRHPWLRRPAISANRLYKRLRGRGVSASSL